MAADEPDDRRDAENCQPDGVIAPSNAQRRTPMGPNDPLANANDPPTPEPVVAPAPIEPRSARVREPSGHSTGRPHLTAAAVGMGFGLCTLLVGWMGTLIVLGYGALAVVGFALFRWVIRELDFAAAYRALTRRD
jgi:hypothetical protein